MKTVKILVSYTIEEAIKLFTEAVQAIKQPDPKLIWGNLPLIHGGFFIQNRGII
jgi:hypothetical protein